MILRHIAIYWWHHETKTAKTCYTLSYWKWNCANIIESWSPLAPLPFFLQVTLLPHNIIWHDIVYEFMWYLHGLVTFLTIKSVGNETERYHEIKVIFIFDMITWLLKWISNQQNITFLLCALNYIILHSMEFNDLMELTYEEIPACGCGK